MVDHIFIENTGDRTLTHREINNPVSISGNAFFRYRPYLVSGFVADSNPKQFPSSYGIPSCPFIKGADSVLSELPNANTRFLHLE